jgi:hypothetical protein
MNQRQLAEVNFAALAANPYPGRGIVVGLDETGEQLVQVYWIMGRSENSRNRIFRSEGGRLFTEAADPSKVKDPSLIIYNAMRETELGGITYAVVSNGKQTDAVADGYAEDQTMHASLRRFSYEPDEPNFTPRITASCRWEHDNPIIKISLLRMSLFNGDCSRHLFEINGVGKGFGHCITTYSGDGKPLPAFQGEPYVLPLCGDAETMAHTFWDAALDADNRVAIAVKLIPKNGPSMTHIINKL